MRKLNITKERFEKSNYFKRKYGKLEYVSESGNLFKTNKGKILKFKESRTSNWKEVDLVWNSDSDLLPDTVFVQVNQGSPSEIDLKYELEKRYDAEIIDINTYHVSRIVSLCDCFKWTGNKLKPFDPSRITGKELRTTWESTKKFGKKFTKESVDVDPALVCPYCGGNNCEVSIGTDDLNFTNLDRLQGETFNVECWCNDCDKPYNVTVELNVKDVYPNEDADELSSDWE